MRLDENQKRVFNEFRLNKRASKADVSLKVNLTARKCYFFISIDFQIFKLKLELWLPMMLKIMTMRILCSKKIIFKSWFYDHDPLRTLKIT